jgi:A/G-specific adenine glycosylase
VNLWLIRLILPWYDCHARDLPWRRERDPYRIWVSEIMLQQTRVSVVIPYYQRFVAAYPTLESLASADETQVLELWAGLGYYRRANSLLRAARRIRDDSGGVFPRSSRQLLGLPGMGRYTAGAVASIAFGEPCPVLDGNVRRLVTRFLGRDDIPDRELWEFLSDLVTRPEIAERVGDFNQALMELGATVCVPRAPRCGECPLAGGCRALAAGVRDSLPTRRRQSRTVVEHFTALVIRDHHQTLMRRRGSEPYLQGFWELPTVTGTWDALTVPAAARDQLGLAVEVQRELPAVHHRITFRDQRYRTFECRLSETAGLAGFQWVTPGHGYPISVLARKLLK